MILPACQAARCALLLWCGITAKWHTVQTGYLSAYAELPTVATLAYRQEIGDVPYDVSGYDVFIAVADCGLIGHEGTLYTNAGALRAIVMDCAGNDGTPFRLGFVKRFINQF